MSNAEREEMDVRKRRAEGTPCNKENFEAWKLRFEEEMAKKEVEEETTTIKDTSGKKKVKNTISLEEIMEGRTTGHAQFTQKKGGLMNLELLEKAAEEAAAASDDEFDDLDVDEDLFDDDEDLDDLDFDDSDEDDDDDSIDI